MRMANCMISKQIFCAGSAGCYQSLRFLGRQGKSVAGQPLNRLAFRSLEMIIKASRLHKQGSGGNVLVLKIVLARKGCLFLRRTRK